MKFDNALRGGAHKHHIMPKAICDKYKNELVDVIGRDVAANIKKIPNKFHGNHPAYSDWMEKKLKKISDDGGINTDEIKKLIKEASDEINKAYDKFKKSGGKENMNDYFKN